MTGGVPALWAAGDRVAKRYRVVEVVLAGTRAQVYRGQDEVLGRDVALKLLSGTGPRARREAEAIGALSHPSIVASLAVFEHDGRLCLVSEWVGGGSLEARVHAALAETGTSLGLDETRRVGVQLAGALAYAHRRAILHRDLKPANVLVSAGGDYKLTDFGAVGSLLEDTHLTQVGEIAGTPLYMSPEQLAGAAQGPTADVFALGLVLHFCLHGTVPGEDADNAIQLAYRRINEPIQVMDSPLSDLIRRCVEIDPSDRIQTADEVVAWLHGAHSGPHPQAVSESSEVAPSPAPPLPEPPFAPPLPAPPHEEGVRVPKRWVAWAGLALVSVAVTLLLTVVFTTADGAAPAGGGGRGWTQATAGVVIGGALAAVGLVLASEIRRRWTSRSPQAEREAAEIILGAGRREDLTESLVIEVDVVVARLDSMDTKIIGTAVKAMVREYEESKSSLDRQAALLNVVTLMEKLQSHLAPWHVRHRDAIASTVAVVACATGVFTAVSGFVD